MSTKWEIMLKEIGKEYDSSPKTFLRQPTISKTVHPNVQNLASRYYTEMLSNPFFVKTILPKMKDSSIGTPFKFNTLPECSPLTVYHSYHLNLIKERLGVFVPTENISHIVEIGGGYGNLCRLIHEFGYSGKYTIADFPQMLKIQKKYLSQHNINDVTFSTLDMEILSPSPGDISILFATFSVNEMPMETRKKIEPYYNQYNYLFFAHNTAFDGINNMEYFKTLKSLLSNDFEIEYFKDTFKNSYFMVCKRINNV